MSEVIDKPIEVASEVLDRAEINGGTVLVQYGKTDAALATLRTKYEGVLFDLTTTAGDKAARAGRLELVTLRTSLEKKRKEFKAPVLEFGAKIDAEAKRITAEIEALEKPIDAQINADEKRRAEEKAERDRIEAERVAGYIARLNTMRGCVAKAQGLPSARIANGIAAVEAIPVEPAAWEEFADQAATVKAGTLAAMRIMFDAAKAREDEDARVEAQRLENEKVAAQQAAEAKRLQDAADALAAQQKAAADKMAAEQAEFNRQRAEFEAQQAEATRVARVKAEAEEQAAQELARKEESDRVAAERAKAAAAEAAIKAAEPAPAHNPLAQVATGTVATHATAPTLAVVQQIPASTLQQPADNADTEQPQIKLGDINARIAPLSISADGLAQLGFTALPVKGAARMYLQSDLPKMIAAMVKNLTTERQLLAAEKEKAVA